MQNKFPLIKSDEILQKVAEKTEKDIMEMHKNWNTDSFTPAHCYPYAFLHNYIEMVKESRENN